MSETFSRVSLALLGVCSMLTSVQAVSDNAEPSLRGMSLNWSMRLIRKSGRAVSKLLMCDAAMTS